MPSVTCPKMSYRRARLMLLPLLMKNWLPIVDDCGSVHRDRAEQIIADHRVSPDRVSRPAGSGGGGVTGDRDRRARGARRAAGIRADLIEVETIIETLSRQEHEVVHRVGCVLRAEADRDDASVGVDVRAVPGIGTDDASSVASRSAAVDAATALPEWRCRTRDRRLNRVEARGRRDCGMRSAPGDHQQCSQRERAATNPQRRVRSARHMVSPVYASHRIHDFLRACAAVSEIPLVRKATYEQLQQYRLQI